jgi:glycosyltransferase involved in cell wall biosynthesis
MLSVVLATYNEEKNIAKCLESIKDIADEIIVVDGSSSDKTKEIAEILEAKVFTTSNKQNFHINKQMAMDKATKQLVLQLDADELVDEELKDFIKKINFAIEKNKKIEVAAWWIRRKNFFCGRFLSKGGQYPDPVIRLYINGKAGLPAKDVHEQMKVNGETAYAEGHLLHYSNPTFADYLRKFQTYTSFKAQQLFEENLSVNPITFSDHVIFKPIKTFFLIYLRHKGFVDSWQGLVFAIFSALHHPVAYLKFLETKYAN